MLYRSFPADIWCGVVWKLDFKPVNLTLILVKSINYRLDVYLEIAGVVVDYYLAWQRVIPALLTLASIYHFILAIGEFSIPKRSGRYAVTAGTLRIVAVNRYVNFSGYAVGGGAVPLYPRYETHR